MAGEQPTYPAAVRGEYRRLAGDSVCRDGCRPHYVEHDEPADGGSWYRHHGGGFSVRTGALRHYCFHADRGVKPGRGTDCVVHRRIGRAGLAVGLALQGSLSNFAAGVLLVVFRPFRTGESVDLGGVAGTVTQVQIFSTTLLTADGKVIVVPNGKIIAGNIINSSREPDRRTEIIVGVAYDADIDVVKTVLGDIVAADTRIQQDKGVTIRLNEMGASSLNFVVRVWTSNGDAAAVYWDLLESFKRALDEHRIGIPYPQMDVHLHHGASSAQTGSQSAPTL